MKPIPPLTEHFFNQAPNPSPLITNPEITALQKQLLDLQKCPLCYKEYMLSEGDCVPRIVVHCGHTFCTKCLERFFIKNRVRCPMCLKLVKKLPSVTDLPINHTIFSSISLSLSPHQLDPYKTLCTQWTITTSKRLASENPPKTDDESGLHYCCFHPERVQHFFCVYHEVPACRECVNVGHKGDGCKVIDLFHMCKQKQQQQQ